MLLAEARQGECISASYDGCVPFSAYAKDIFVGPYMSSFKSAEIADMSACDPEQEHWVSNFILNTLVGSKPKDPQRQYMFNFLRHTQAAFREYALARDQTQLFLSHPDAPSHYLLAVTHWEHFLMHDETAWNFLFRFADRPIDTKFSKKDGSVRQRLNNLYNLSKHAREDQFATDSTLAVWLDNDGLNSTTDHLTFEEAADDLRHLARWADRMQDPGTFRAKVKAAIDSGEDC
jgi:hypothetical protein